MHALSHKTIPRKRCHLPIYDPDTPYPDTLPAIPQLMQFKNKHVKNIARAVQQQIDQMLATAG